MIEDEAAAVIEAIQYVTLGTVDANGDPWTSPVYFAADGDRFYWVSASDALHSRHLVARPRISVVVFDSTVDPYRGRAVYGIGTARELSDVDSLERAMACYPRRDGRGATEVTFEDVTGESPYRMYEVRVTEAWVLCPRQPGLPCTLHGRTGDHRVEVTLS
ncbi:hypothetical protein Rhe02_18780 [Rhizocola hellebori]|uniref:Pyridoxamine 5'-phosphate oxidase N-terminal domain-containing protein n=1 Tax=Rhizocola hellebori TaxID=1392758 RepID=A0A8J3Q4Z5_9ACTN|nr:pyridoxamine 5'-phosphate oxidase family protein [Rhizocola hellebori]GIH03811.1 hypothetical protein Rhe02_18780 [Rhizocola hellebori]